MTDSEQNQNELKLRKHQKRLARWFAFLHWLAGPFVRHKFNYSYDSLENIKGPYLLLCNHNVDWDPIFVGLAAKHQIYFVATENVLRKKLGAWFLKTFFDPVIITKGRSGARSSMEMLKLLKRGWNVALFAEGNRSFDGITGEIPAATGKLARRSGASLVTYRIEGGYLSQPRWSTTLRRGKLTGKCIHIYTPEELQQMTDGEVQSAIEADLHEDAWETQRRERIPFRGKKQALGMESTLYACPACQSFGSLKSDDSGISCSCGLRAELTELGFLKLQNGTETTVADWNRQQKQLLRRVLESPGEQALFSDKVSLGVVNGHEIPEMHSAGIAAYTDRVELDGKILPPGAISGAAIFSRNVLTLHLSESGEQYEIRGNTAFNALKYYDFYKMTHKE